MSFQDSIRNSADATVLSSPDSLVVSLTKSDGDAQQTTTTTSSSSFIVSSPRKNHRAQVSGINDLDSLNFTYKVTN